MMKNCLRKIILCAFCMAVMATGFCRSDTAKNSPYDMLSLKDLWNIKIVSISKQPELLFEAPLSASVISKEDIQRAGCTSIMEAMRLVPGIIVRQQSNGNYDIHLGDDVPFMLLAGLNYEL